ncbi:hypothetical protein HCU64_19400 [Methylobacterium sp. C25]|uniref:hypothetical protein n=1 Tax=Methylobacterium sp. C25 TaxID=2721622 RepID=UPI001F37DA98|nr:hypothetical protein [Methylobacterium sp. C25]MCE4225923.1 hypothetical protein [Methylobacterium sp. C25]
MSLSSRSVLTAAFAFGSLCALSIGANAQPLLHHAIHHTSQHAQAVREEQPGPYVNTGFAETPREYEGASRRAWIGGERDDDSANAKNPALPWYERGRGSETGGPARMLIGGE